MKMLLVTFFFCACFAFFCSRNAWSTDAARILPRERSLTAGLSGQSRIDADRGSKKRILISEEDGPWEIFISKHPERFVFTDPVLSGNGRGSFVIPVEEGQRWYFALRGQSGTKILAEELLPLSGGYNFRDLGGLPAADGRRTAWGKLFRADGLGSLTDEDLAYLASIPIVTVVDFRTEREALKAPDRLPASVKHALHYPMQPGNLQQLASGMEGADAWDAFMQEMNRSLVLDEANIAVYRKFFSYLQKEDFLPLLFHCSAGKDRTGLASVYILLALGVDQKIVMRNYMDSMVYLAGKYDAYIRKDPDKAPLFSVKPQYLQAAIGAMEEKSGSVEDYLVEVLNIDLQKMRQLFLQKAEQ